MILKLLYFRSMWYLKRNKKIFINIGFKIFLKLWNVFISETLFLQIDICLYVFLLNFIYIFELYIYHKSNKIRNTYTNKKNDKKLSQDKQQKFISSFEISIINNILIYLEYFWKTIPIHILYSSFHFSAKLNCSELINKFQSIFLHTNSYTCFSF